MTYQFADLILTGAKVYTLDPNNKTADTIAIHDDRILHVGNMSDMASFAGPDTKIKNLDGGSILPGINDAHLHGAWYGATWPKLMFTNHDFDWHGKIIDSEQGREEAILTAWQQLAEMGITSYTEPGIGSGEDQGATGCFGTNIFDTYRRLAGTNKQTARVTMLRLFGLLDGASNWESYLEGLNAPLPETDKKWLSVTGIKIFADGIPPMKSAWTNQPYRDGGNGFLFTGEGEEAERLSTFRKMIFAAHDRGLQIGVHATGDRTAAAFIDALAEVDAQPSARHYIIHGDLLDLHQLKQMNALGIGIDFQPLIADQTMTWLRDAVENDVADRAWPIHEMIKATWVTMTSDAPVASPDWRVILQSAAKRLQNHNVQIDKEMKIKLLQMVTKVPAYQDFADDWKGTLEPGKVADLCWIDGDVLGDDFFALPELGINMTMTGGRIVFEQ